MNPPERRDVLILAPVASAVVSVPIFDPERPRVDPNKLLRALGGKLTDPRKVSHNCPLCNETMRWELFEAHAPACIQRWGKTVDPIHRRYAGADLPPAEED